MRSKSGWLKRYCYLPKPVAHMFLQKKRKSLYFRTAVYCRGKLKYTGKWEEVSLEEAYEAAKIAAINCLAVIKQQIGSLDKIKQIIKVVGYVANDPGFTDHGKVVNGHPVCWLEIFEIKSMPGLR